MSRCMHLQSFSVLPPLVAINSSVGQVHGLHWSAQDSGSPSRSARTAPRRRRLRYLLRPTLLPSMAFLHLHGPPRQGDLRPALVRRLVPDFLSPWTSARCTSTGYTSPSRLPQSHDGTSTLHHITTKHDQATTAQIHAARATPSSWHPRPLPPFLLSSLSFLCWRSAPQLDGDG